MSTLYILIGILYVVGVFLVMLLDKTIQVATNIKNSHGKHTLILFILWLISPALLLYLCWEMVVIVKRRNGLK